jgi:hypothetical protein
MSLFLTHGEAMGSGETFRLREQQRIGTTLREMYADLVEQPRSPRLTLLVHEIDVGWKAPIPHG